MKLAIFIIKMFIFGERHRSDAAGPETEDVVTELTPARES